MRKTLKKQPAVIRCGVIVSLLITSLSAHSGNLAACNPDFREGRQSVVDSAMQNARFREFIDLRFEEDNNDITNRMKTQLDLPTICLSTSPKSEASFNLQHKEIFNLIDKLKINKSSRIEALWTYQIIILIVETSKEKQFDIIYHNRELGFTTIKEMTIEPYKIEKLMSVTDNEFDKNDFKRAIDNERSLYGLYFYRMSYNPVTKKLFEVDINTITPRDFWAERYPMNVFFRIMELIF